MNDIMIINTATPPTENIIVPYKSKAAKERNMRNYSDIHTYLILCKNVRKIRK